MMPRLAEVRYSAEEGLTIRVQPRTFQLVPDAARGHMRAANKEMLLALRSIIDQAIERTEEGGGRRRRRIRVEMGNESGEEEEGQGQ